MKIGTYPFLVGQLSKSGIIEVGFLHHKSRRDKRSQDAKDLESDTLTRAVTMQWIKETIL
jgi:hypothetical protein